MKRDSIATTADLGGGVVIHSLLDAEGSFANFRDVFPAASANLVEVGRSFYGQLFAGDAWRLPFRAFLVMNEHGNVLVDTGVGPPPSPFLPAAQGQLVDALRAIGMEPRDIDVVFFTHLHVDHVGWAAVAGEPYFRKARYCVSRADVGFFANRAESRETFEAKLAPLERRGVLETPDEMSFELLPGVRAVGTPGHTPGHMSVHVQGGSASAWIIGDLAVHPLQVEDVTLPYVHEVDAALAAKVRRDRVAELTARGVLVAAGHFPYGGFGRITRPGEESPRWVRWPDTASRAAPAE
jgi:glyoxylase-like metal-dependent hydrolase (beta-lactamase superfamily II)